MEGAAAELPAVPEPEKELVFGPASARAKRQQPYF